MTHAKKVNDQRGERSSSCLVTNQENHLSDSQILIRKLLTEIIAVREREACDVFKISNKNKLDRSGDISGEGRSSRKFFFSIVCAILFCVLHK